MASGKPNEAWEQRNKEEADESDPEEIGDSESNETREQAGDGDQNETAAEARESDEATEQVAGGDGDHQDQPTAAGTSGGAGVDEQLAGALSELSVTEPGWLAKLLKDTAPEWYTLLKDHMLSDRFKDFEKWLETEYETPDISPPKDKIFEAFKKTKPSEVKVVIVGQDPDPQLHQANGLAFSRPDNDHDVRPGSSLSVIFDEMEADLGEEREKFTRPQHGYLGKWAENGVLLLNSILTLRVSKSGSHAENTWDGTKPQQMWQSFTDKVVQVISEIPDKRVAFLLWGKTYAHEKDSSITHKDRHLVLKAGHPSLNNQYNKPDRNAYRADPNRQFNGCKHFSKTLQSFREWKIPFSWNFE
ncbi:hypothetical protein BaRGS_00021069 [Batillaria attramentaria]|uniref:Uracil-DNA glycosylase-like domain-containing protein n=1 Tax=Batillaria attramentaria TaxID=370345 RepID=A0ABD0KKE0_9CAEN